MARDLGAVNAHDFEGWFPFRISLDERGEIAVDWFLLGEDRLGDDRFFADTVARCARHPFNLVFRRRSGVAALLRAAELGRDPNGLIFHLSRCGSTLAAQMFAALPHVFVLSEPGPFNDVVTLPASAVDDDTRVALLRAAARALGAHARERHERYVVKLDAWHARSIALFERAFPEAGWIYVYRDPLEVMVSHLATPSYMMSAANAHATLDLHVTEAMRIPNAVRCAEVLKRIGDAVLARAPRPQQLVAYDEIAQAIPERAASLFGVTIAPDDRDLMHAVRGYHAKQPGVPFTDDRAAKRDAAAPDLRAYVDEHLMPIHGALDRLRASA